MQALRAEQGLGEVLWIVGGNIPAEDRPALEALGVDRVFPTGTPFEEIVAFLDGALRGGARQA
jgi:methylmalonyl-CoA mutase C-terminal domain/subunit